MVLISISISIYMYTHIFIFITNMVIIKTFIFNMNIYYTVYHIYSTHYNSISYIKLQIKSVGGIAISNLVICKYRCKTLFVDSFRGVIELKSVSFSLYGFRGERFSD